MFRSFCGSQRCRSKAKRSVSQSATVCVYYNCDKVVWTKTMWPHSNHNSLPPRPQTADCLSFFFSFLMHNKSTLVCSEEAKSRLLETDAQWVGVPHIFSSAGFAFSPCLRVYNNSKYLLCFKQAHPALNKYHRVKGAVAAQLCHNMHFHSVKDPDGNKFVGLLFNEGKNYTMNGKGNYLFVFHYEIWFIIFSG